MKTRPSFVVFALGLLLIGAAGCSPKEPTPALPSATTYQPQPQSQAQPSAPPATPMPQSSTPRGSGPPQGYPTTR